MPSGSWAEGCVYISKPRNCRVSSFRQGGGRKTRTQRLEPWFGWNSSIESLIEARVPECSKCKSGAIIIFCIQKWNMKAGAFQKGRCQIPRRRGHV